MPEHFSNLLSWLRLFLVAPCLSLSWNVSAQQPGRAKISLLAADAAPHFPIWDLSENPKGHVIWRASIGTSSGPPVICGDHVLIGTNNFRPRDRKITEDRGVVMCFSKQTGKFLWQVCHTRLPYRANDIPGTGIRCTPCFHNQRLYYYSNRGELVCLFVGGKERESRPTPAPGAMRPGQVIWKLDLVNQLGVFKRDAGDVGNPLPSPIVVGQFVYCVTGNGSTYGYDFGKLPYVPSSTAPSFVAVDKDTGKVGWSCNAPGKNIMYAQWSSPVFAGKGASGTVIFPAGDGYLYGLDPIKGQILWKVDCNDPHASRWGPQKARGSRCFFVGAPSLKNNFLFVGINQDLETSSTISRPIYAIDLGKGKASTRDVKWQFNPPGFDGTWGSLAIAGDIGYVLSGLGVLYALDLATGRELWRDALGDEPYPVVSPFFCSPCVHKGLVFVPVLERLYLYKPGKERQCLGSYDLASSRMTSPAFEENTMYVATDYFLWAIRLHGGVGKPRPGPKQVGAASRAALFNPVPILHTSLHLTNPVFPIGI